MHALRHDILSPSGVKLTLALNLTAKNLQPPSCMYYSRTTFTYLNPVESERDNVLACGRGQKP